MNDLWSLGTFVLNTTAWTSNTYFNQFFTLVSFFGLLSFAVSCLVGLVRSRWGSR